MNENTSAQAHSAQTALHKPHYLCATPHAPQMCMTQLYIELITHRASKRDASNVREEEVKLRLAGLAAQHAR